MHFTSQTLEPARETKHGNASAAFSFLLHSRRRCVSLVLYNTIPVHGYNVCFCLLFGASPGHYRHPLAASSLIVPPSISNLPSATPVAHSTTYSQYRPRLLLLRKQEDSSRQKLPCVIGSRPIECHGALVNEWPLRLPRSPVFCH